jgi:hypothetical protein
MNIRYKTPQAVHDFIRRFRKDQIHLLRQHGHFPDLERAVEANILRMEAFLLDLIEKGKTERPEPPEEHQEVVIPYKPENGGGWSW